MNYYRYRRGCQCMQNQNNDDMDMPYENNIISNSGCQNIPETPIDNCSCGFDNGENEQFPMNPMYGQSYVPIQKMNKVFNPETGLKMGTIFPELVSPYVPCQSIREIEFLKNSNEIGEGCNG